MAKCSHCGAIIVFGGSRRGNLRFCNDKCMQKFAPLSMLDQLPEDLVQRYVASVHSGKCPKCQGEGPVDVHTSHRVWSAFVVTTWDSRPQICCQSCGFKSKVADIVFCMLFGWWGFPWGLIATPIQVLRNLAGAFTAPNPDQPSEQLATLLRLELAAKALDAQQHGYVEPSG